MSQKISLPASKSTTSKYTKWFVTFVCWKVYRKCTKWIPTLWKRKEASPPPDFNNFQGRTVTRSEGTINALVMRAKFSPPVVELVRFIRFSNGYYHSDRWCSTFTNCYPSQLVVYNAHTKGALRHCFAVKQEMFPSVFTYLLYVLPNCIRS